MNKKFINKIKKKLFLKNNKFYRLCSSLKFLTIYLLSLMSDEKISFIMDFKVLLLKVLWLMILLVSSGSNKFL